MTTAPSVTWRVALALALMVGFYVLAVAIAAALVYVPYAEFTYAHRIHPKLAFFCIAGAATILWSILPRADRFVPPGPVLERGQHPRLFTEIEGVARATGQDMPSEVFLVGDVNAWVAQRGGVMGFFSRRVMGIGLPLLDSLSLSEFRAVMAHEFGHFHGGDTKLGPWVHKTRAAIGRTIAGLGDSWLQKPFLWYGKLFLRISHAVSRRQEFSADALASRVAGSRPLVEGLKKAETASMAFEAYWAQEVAPVLQAGFLPPITEGFRAFAASEHVKHALAGALEAGMRNAKADPYDTHPPLAERVEAVSHLPAGPDPSSEPPAISLLRSVDGLERALLASVAGPDVVDSLTPTDWAAVAPSVLLPRMRETASRQPALLRQATMGELATVVAKEWAGWSGLVGEFRERKEGEHLWVFAAAVTMALERAGWTIEALPGAAVTARQGGETVLPFELVRQLGSGSMSDEQWRAEAARLGVTAVPLGA